MSVRLRFAPSPTGKLHVGNLRTALFNYLFARSHPGGNFMLRLDDTDAERSTEAFAVAIKRDLTQLGLVPDREMRQSDRFDRYHAAADKLKAAGLLYEAYDTPDELERKRRRLLAKGQPPIYDRAALQLTDAEKAELKAQGRRPHLRFLLQPGTVVFNDLIRGEVVIDTASLSDPVLIREDGSFLYTLCSVVDDIDTDITHIIRGEDHVTNTAVQVRLFQSLAPDRSPPIFAHHPLLTDASGDKLSKRLGSLSSEALFAEGVEALSIVSYLARLGTSDPIVPVTSIAQAAAGFSLGKVSHGAARFSQDELRNLNAKVIALLPHETVAERLPGVSAELWSAVRSNLQRVADAEQWRQITADDYLPDNYPATEVDFLTSAAACLPTEPWDGTLWKTWTQALAAATGRKGRALFMPLRLALTGQEHGPEMAALLPLLARASVQRRLRMREYGGYENAPEPTRFGDWEKKGGIISDF